MYSLKLKVSYICYVKYRKHWQSKGQNLTILAFKNNKGLPWCSFGWFHALNAGALGSGNSIAHATALQISQAATKNWCSQISK